MTSCDVRIKLSGTMRGFVNEIPRNVLLCCDLVSSVCNLNSRNNNCEANYFKLFNKFYAASQLGKN